MTKVLFVEKQVDYEPQGIMTMSAVLKQAGHDVRLAIAAQEDPLKIALDYQPDIIGYSSMTGSQRYYLELNRRLKESLGGKFHAIMGGPHPTFFPDIINEDGLDSVCIGEGEYALLDLADSMANGGVRADIYNLWIKHDGEIVKNPVRPLIHDLSSLPMPDRALVYDKHLYTRNSPIKHFMGSRGCPYQCTYCFNHAYYQIYKREKRGHQRDVDHLCDEINWVAQRYRMDQVIFLDDLFIIFNDWLEEFAEVYPKRVGIPFFCNVRANLMTPEKVALLKKAGCTTVSMGVEAGNDRMRNDLLKRKMTRETMIEAGRMIRDGGIHLSATNILGIPTGTLEDDLLTMQVNSEAHISYAHAFLFQPYPGTELGQFAEQNGFMAGTYDDIGEIAWDSSIMVFQSEDEKRQIENLQRWFAIGVEFPWLTPTIRQLIKAPRNGAVDGAYWMIEKLWRGYAIKNRIHPHKLSAREFFEAVRHFMAMDA
ncbi:MAG: B12-binding domain-containing radical SAM protein [Chloroflexi bacterium]|nr:B12-binding domain-containing radical SAM protein [Chloroflexota bacterium]